MANYIQNVPNELLTDIVARVASSSIKDYFSLKLSAKLFKKAVEDNFVYKHMCFDEFPVFGWYGNVNETTDTLINRCIDCENPDALYRKGMAEYFAWNNVGEAVWYLEKALDLGHKGAYYVSTLILLGKGKHEDEGFEYFRIMKISHEEYNITIYRKHVAELLESILMKIPCKTFDREPTYCTRHDWVEESCDACLCDEEIRLLFSFMPAMPLP